MAIRVADRNDEKLRSAGGGRGAGNPRDGLQPARSPCFDTGTPTGAVTDVPAMHVQVQGNELGRGHQGIKPAPPADPMTEPEIRRGEKHHSGSPREAHRGSPRRYFYFPSSHVLDLVWDPMFTPWLAQYLREQKDGSATASAILTAWRSPHTAERPGDDPPTPNRALPAMGEFDRHHKARVASARWLLAVLASLSGLLLGLTLARGW